MTLFFYLVFAHCLADYPLQGQFLAVEKSAYKWPNRDFPWQIAMGAHCFIHAGFVAALTGSLWLALAEFFMHWVTDAGKCADLFGPPKQAIYVDQTVHILCKLLWALTITLGVIR